MSAATNFTSLTINGVPVTGGSDLPYTTGTVFYVHSGTGHASNAGTSAGAPLATIDSAINLCTAAKGDLIIVMPGHAETVSGASTIIPDVAGISIIGLGTGRNRPVLTFSATGSKITVSGANTLVRNIVFTADVSAVVTGVAVTAADVTFDNCQWDFVDTGDDFAIMLLATSVARLTVSNCSFIAENTAGCNAGIQFNACTNMTISNNRFEGDYTTAVLNGVTAASTGVFILHNFLRNSDTTAGLLLTTFTASTGLAAYNSGGSLYATDILATWVNTSVLSIENYIVNVVTETAGIAPATAST
jgi:hypothetical protein